MNADQPGRHCGIRPARSAPGLTDDQLMPLASDRLVLAALLTGVILMMLTVIHPAIWWTLLLWLIIAGTATGDARERRCSAGGQSKPGR